MLEEDWFSEDEDFDTDLQADSDKDPALIFGTHTRILALVPWADMLNHSSRAGSAACLKYDHSSQCAVLHAHRLYEPTEQVDLPEICD